MACVLMEGWDHFQPSSQMTRTGWSSNVSTQGSGRYGTGQYAQTSGSAGGSYFKNLPGTYTKLWTGFAMRSSNPAVASSQLFLWRNGSTNTLRMANNTSGQVTLTNSGGTVILGPSTRTISSSVWHYFEIYLFVNGASGQVEMRIDGTVELSVATVNIGSSGIQNVGFGFVNSQNTQIDDLYVFDDTGTVNNTYNGDSRIETLFMTAEGNSATWTPTSGTDNAAMIDDTTTIDDDTTYIASDTVGQVDTYVAGDLAMLTGNVAAIQTNIDARKLDSGTRQIADVVRHASSDDVGTTKTLAATYATYQQIRELNPASGAWTVSDINADEYGVKLVA